MSSTFLRVSIICLLTTFILSCQPTLTMVDTSCSGYIGTTFNKDMIATKGIAVLPVLGGSEKEEYRRPVGDALSYKFKDSFPNSNVLSTVNTLSILNEAGLADDYAQAVRDYKEVGLLNKELLKNMGDALGVRYVIYSQLLADSDYDYSTQVTINELMIDCQVWDLAAGDVVWEGKGGAAYSNFHRGEKDLVDVATTGLVNKLGSTPKNNCATGNALVESQRQAQSTGLIVGTTVPLLALLIYLGVAN